MWTRCSTRIRTPTTSSAWTICGRLAFTKKEKIPLYADDAAATVIERVFNYTFDPDALYATRARVEMHRLNASVAIQGKIFERVPLIHGEMEVAGFRFGNAAYLTDMSDIPREQLAAAPGAGCPHPRRAAPRAASQPRHARSGPRIRAADRAAAALSLPTCLMTCPMKKPTAGFPSTSGSPTTGCTSPLRSDHVRL